MSSLNVIAMRPSKLESAFLSIGLEIERGCQRCAAEGRKKIALSNVRPQEFTGSILAEKTSILIGQNRQRKADGARHDALAL